MTGAGGSSWTGDGRGRLSARHRSGVRYAWAAAVGALALSSVFVVITAQPVAALTFTVDTAGDNPDANPGDGICRDNLDLECSLRAAIQEANASVGGDTITFNIGGVGVHTISPATPLPPVTEPVEIDGYTQPGATENIGPGFDANLLIEIDGTNLGGAAGIEIAATAPGSVVRGLVINNFDGGGGSGIVAGPNSFITGNIIGADSAGTGIRANDVGVRIPSGVSGVAVGSSAIVDRNLISGNGTGIQIEGNADNNIIQNNFIGTARNGTSALPNVNGIATFTADANLAGLDGLVIGGLSPAAGNVISGNSATGIVLEGENILDAQIYSNRIGTSANGSTAVPNVEGILLGFPGGTVSRTLIGAPGAGNVISGNVNEGIDIWSQGVSDTVIRSNLIGVAADGVSPLGNNSEGPTLDPFNYGGVVIRNLSSGNVIGGTGVGDGNTIAYNNNGVVVFSGIGNTVVGNSTFDNLGGGIWFVGAEVNDAGDVDESNGVLQPPNRGQNFPTLTSATIDAAGDVVVGFEVDSSLTSSTYPIALDFYRADTAQSGEGEARLGGETLVGPGASATNLGPATAIGLRAGDVIVATATDAQGNTSNFSAVIAPDGVQRDDGRVTGDELGRAVDIDGDRMAVSRPGADVGATNAGAVDIYERAFEGSPWGLVATITTPTPEAGGGFGDSVALSGNQIAIGESDAYGDLAEPGRVWVFEYDGSTWDLVDRFEAPPPQAIAGDRFGFAISWIGGTQLLVGAPGTPAGGDLYRLDYVSGSVTNLNAGLSQSPGDELGFSVDVTPQPIGTGTGYWAIVGAPGKLGSGGGAGANGGGGHYIITLDAAGDSAGWRGASGFANGTRSGSGVAIDGNRAVVGSYGSGTMSFDFYEYRDFGAGLEWTSEVGRSAGTSAGFETGIAANQYIDIEGDRIAVAQPGSGGGVALFRIDGTDVTSTPADFFQPTGREDGDRIGRSIALDGVTMIAGAPGDDGDGNALPEAGSVYSARVPNVLTFTNTDTGTTQPWEDPTNWDRKLVPGPRDSVIVPVGTYPEINAATTVARLSVAGNLRVDSQFDVTERLEVAGPSGVLDTQPGSTLRLPPSVVLDGELVPGGTVVATGVTTIGGTGEFVNDGELRKTGGGDLTLGVDIDWTSYWYSELTVEGGRVDIQGPLLSSSGSFDVAAGAELVIAGSFGPGPGSRLATEIVGPSSNPANYGRILVGGNFSYEPEAPFPGPGELELTADISGYVPSSADVYSLVSCGGDCTQDGTGEGSGPYFDEINLGPLDAVLTVPALNLQLVENKVTRTGSYRFGTDIDVDGDWMVVGAQNDGTSVYERVNGVWEFREAIGSPATGSNVAIGGDTLVADGYLYGRDDVSLPFDDVDGADATIDGTSFDIDGDLLLAGATNFGTSATVSSVDGTGPIILEPIDPVPSYGSDVAVVDLGGGQGIAAVAAVDAGTVYVFALNAGTWSGPVVFDSPDGDPTKQFGYSVALSADRLVVGEPINGGGVAWVYERTGPGATFGTPTRLTASNGGGGNQFGASVAIDGDTIAVGDFAAQKPNFPARDGAAYVFQFDGGVWIETDLVRADDGFDGEGFGWSIGLSGANLVVGAPNDTNSNGDEAGAIYTYGVSSVRPTFVNTAFAADWNTSANWSTGVVPGPTDRVIVPAGTSPAIAVGTDVDVRQLDLGGQLFVNGDLAVGSGALESSIGAAGVLWVESGGTLTVRSPLDLDAGGQLTIRAAATVELTGNASIEGTGLVGNSGQVVASGPGVVTIGTGIGWNSAPDSVVDVVDGTLDIQSTAFDTQGDFAVSPGALLQFASGVTLADTSALEIGITGPSASVANYGRVFVGAGDFVANGSLDVALSGDDPTAADEYDIVTCGAAVCTSGTFDSVTIGTLTLDVTANVVRLLGTAPIVTGLDFGLDLAAGAPSQLAVAPLGIAVNQLDRTAIERSGGATSNVAAASISTIGPEDTSLASIKLGSTPLRSVILRSVPLRSVPLVNIDIDGGWPAIIEGSELENEPLSSLTFGQVLEEGDPVDLGTPAGRIADTPLRSVEVDGTPLESIPLAALALGTTPLRSVPLRSVAPGEENPWCEIIGDLADDYADCDDALDELTLTEITLRGVSVDAIPLRSVPLRSVDTEASPLRSVLLDDISLAASPIGSIPLRSVPLRSVELQDSPLRSVPLRSVPLRSVPVSAIDLDQIAVGTTRLRSVELNSSPLRSVTTSITLEAAPLRSVDAAGTPLTAIQVQGAPLRSVPVSAVVLADTPLRSVPIEEGGEPLDWCELLAEIGGGYDCTSGVDLDETTISDLSLRSVPLRSVPLRSVPLRSVDLPASPLRSVPLRSVPLRSVPLGGIPMSTDLGSIDIDSSPLRSVPLRSVPLRSVDLAGTALGAIPLRSVAPEALPLRSVPLRSVPLRSVPLRSVPLDQISVGATPLRSVPLRSVDVVGSPLRSVPLRSVDQALLDCTLVDCVGGTLGDAVEAGAISLNVTLGQIQSATDGIALGDIADAFTQFTEAELIAAIDQSNLTLDDLTSLDDLTLAELPRGIFELDEVTLGALLDGLPVGRLSDLLGAIIDPETGQPVVGLEDALLGAIDDLDLVLEDLEVLGDITLDDLFAGSATITLEDIEPVLRFVTVGDLQAALNITVDLGTLTLGELSGAELGHLTLADLSELLAGSYDAPEIGDLLEALGLADLIDQYTLGDLLLALIDPASLAFGGVEFAQVDTASLPPGTVGATTFSADFRLTAASPRLVTVTIAVPVSAGFVTGTGEVTADGGPPEPLEPTVGSTGLDWTFTADPFVDYSISFDVLPTLRLGSTTLDGTARVVGTDISVPASASVTVVEGAEPNDFTTADETTSAAEDVVYLTYIPTVTDVDVYEITVNEDDELVVELSNLDADLDVALWGRAPAGTGALGGTSDEIPLFAVTDPDGAAIPAQPLDDVPPLSGVDPSLGLVAVSNLPGTATERITTGRLSAGTYYIQVAGSNGATTVRPAALQLKVLEAEEQPECRASEIVDPLVPRGAAPSMTDLEGADTLILVNEQRIEQLHGAPARADIVRAANDLVTAARAENSTLGITPVVVPVDAYLGVRTAYTAWDAAGGSCDPDAANAVVAAINEIIDPLRDNLEHIVILGGDELIPMARVADKTSIANEYDYRHEFDGDVLDPATGLNTDGQNSLTSTMWNSRILTDDPYGDAAARSLGDRYLYVTDVALGRVVESPDEIVEAIETYLEFNGELDIETATVLGYDFLSDGSEAVAATLVANGVDPVDDELATGGPTNDQWDKGDATAKLVAAGTRALVSLNAHFDHYRALPAVGDKVAGFDDNLIATAVAQELGTRALEQSLIFSMGCHSGLSVSDITIGRTNQDWAQVLGQQGSLFVGNTGFGYGDTETVAYTEALMALFAERVTAPLEVPGSSGSSTVGQALAWAKNDYVAGLQTFSVYDEKAVQESTFYGLPFYRIGSDDLPVVPVPPTPIRTTTPDPTATPSLGVTLQSTNTLVETESGDYYTNPNPDGTDNIIVAPGRPIQPKVTSDISVVDPTTTAALDQVAHGALIVGMESTYVSLTDPVVATPIFDESTSQPEPELDAGLFPTKPLEITRATGPAGDRQSLVAATGQYDVEAGVQRLDDDITTVVYYADLDQTDFTPPTIGAVTSSRNGDELSIEVPVDAGAGDSVDRVVALVAEDPELGGAAVSWRSLELTRSSNPNVWTGTLELTPGTDNVQFFVQAKDEVGNVGFATNKAQNFTDAAPAPTPGPAAPVIKSVSAPTTPQVVTNEVTVSANFSDPSIPEDTFTATVDWGDGTTSDVEVQAATPGNGSVTATHLYSITGSYEVVITITDSSDLSDEEMAPIVVVAPGGVPIVTTVTGPTTPQSISAPITVGAQFTDASAPFDTFQATIDWGDGSTSAGTVVPPVSASQFGTVSGSHTYAEPGVYAIGVTVADAAGGTGTQTFEFAVVYDPATNGRVSGSGAYWSGAEARPGGPKWGRPATFGYHARYKNNATLPSGETELRLLGDFYFKSTAYDYLIVNDAIAIAEGLGKIGTTQYRFRVQGIDNGWLDFFQITIWNPTTGEVVYDNGVLYDKGDLVLLGGIKVKPAS